MSEDYFSGRNNAARYEIGALADDKGVAYASVKGRTGEDFERVMRVQQHGFASSPPKGSHALGIAMGNRQDGLLLLGGEHPIHRPRNLGDGNTAIYNADGSILKFVGKDVSFDAAGNVIYTFKTFTIKCGGVTLKMSGDGLDITGGRITHDGHDTGKTHLHLNAGGAGLSGPPE